ncbi:MAG: type I restriction-modification enzyme R subunit C-terminal domain-containing protein, partial [Chloroflexota bacterium]
QLSDSEQERWENLDWGESDAVPEAVDSAAINQWLFNLDTIDLVLKALMAHGLKVAGGDRLGKTIIFAKNSDHAKKIVERFDANYPKWAGNFTRQIDYSINYASTLIDDFGKKESAPHIAVSVDMLDTGVDVPEVVNLVFFKVVRSKTKFFQMIGRGTRLCEDLFGLDLDKENFRIFDFCGNFEFFRFNPDGVKGGGAIKPLRQRLFESRLSLLNELKMLNSPELTPLISQTTNLLHAYVQGMNLDNFIVRPQRQYVEPYQKRARWESIGEDDLNELYQQVANLPSELPDDPETAKRFDLLIHHLQLAMVRDESRSIEILRERIMQTAAQLTDSGSIPDVQKVMPTIQRLLSDSFWQEVSLTQLEDVRRQVRGVTKFIVRKAQKPLVTDFTDELGEVKPTYLPEISQGVNTAQYRRKVAQFIHDNEDAVVIHKIRWAMPLLSEDLEALDELVFSAEAVGSETEFAKVFGTPKNMAQFVRSLVGLNRQAAKEKFGEFLDGKLYNSDQIEFVNYIVNHLTRNGTMDPSLLWERPFVDIHNEGPAGLFSEEDTQRLIGIVNSVNDSLSSL